ncbi:hypothetical protein AA14337_3026 [Acetobacter malorum DSM 14337]|uniref:Uncharacterized protein n=1 Tax=Acetobacter malorum DSM 14337 TaxID=1307910 RepID=A0ABQ0PZ93_9PROT|nr:hypothetical protein [Acetobacter malorum]KXV05620.1 hypothetical protein AD930_10785 [Acetobacter malorum]GBQ85263.1 hypothetical protein AA14337_3026 [Acetobacter malorum DSM 14337]
MPSAPTPIAASSEAFKDVFRRNAGISLDDLMSAHPRVNLIAQRVDRIAPELSDDVFQQVAQQIMSISGLKPDNKPHNDYRLALLQYAAADPRWHIGNGGVILSSNREHDFEMDVIAHRDGYAFAASRDNQPLEMVHAIDIGEAVKGVRTIHLQQRLEIKPHPTAPALEISDDPEMEVPEVSEDYDPPSP